MKINYQYVESENFKKGDLKKIYDSIFDDAVTRKWISYGEFIMKIKNGETKGYATSLEKYVFKNLVN